MVIGKVPRRPGGMKRKKKDEEPQIRRGKRNRVQKTFGSEFEVSLPGVKKNKEEDVFDEDFKFESDEEVESVAPSPQADKAGRRKKAGTKLRKKFFDFDLDFEDFEELDKPDAPSKANPRRGNRVRKQKQLDPDFVQEEEQDDEEEESSEIFYVEKVLKHRSTPKGLEFFVKWFHYPASDNSWLKEADFAAGEMIKAYMEKTGAADDAGEEFEEEGEEEEEEESEVKIDPKKLKSYPTLIKRFLNCMEALNDGHRRQGVSRSLIYKWIGKNYPGTFMESASKTIANCRANGLVVYGSSNARFKLTTAGKEMIKQNSKNKKISKKKKTTPKKKNNRKERISTPKKKASSPKRPSVGKKKKSPVKNSPPKQAPDVVRRSTRDRKPKIIFNAGESTTTTKKTTPKKATPKKKVPAKKKATPKKSPAKKKAAVSKKKKSPLKKKTAPQPKKKAATKKATPKKKASTKKSPAKKKKPTPKKKEETKSSNQTPTKTQREKKSQCS